MTTDTTARTIEVIYTETFQTSSGDLAEYVVTVDGKYALTHQHIGRRSHEWLTNFYQKWAFRTYCERNAQVVISDAQYTRAESDGPAR